MNAHTNSDLLSVISSSIRMPFYILNIHSLRIYGISNNILPLINIDNSFVGLSYEEDVWNQKTLVLPLKLMLKIQPTLQDITILESKNFNKKNKNK